MYSQNLKIGVLGSGVVGQVLAQAFMKEGHAVMLGSRNLSKDPLLKWKSANPDATIGSYADTVAYGDVLILATPGTATEEIVRHVGKERFGNKIVIDATNPIAAEPPVNGVLKFFT